MNVVFNELVTLVTPNRYPVWFHNEFSPFGTALAYFDATVSTITSCFSTIFNYWIAILDVTPPTPPILLGVFAISCSAAHSHLAKDLNKSLNSALHQVLLLGVESQDLSPSRWEVPLETQDSYFSLMFTATKLILMKVSSSIRESAFGISLQSWQSAQ